MGTPRLTFRHPELLGTVVDITIDPVELVGDALSGDSGGDDSRGGAAADSAERVAAILFGEMERLESVFSVFDPESELRRWRQTNGPGLSDGSDEFNMLMAEALRWQQLTGGLFNPLAGELVDLWLAASESDAGDPVASVPDTKVLRDRAMAIAEPRYKIVDGMPVATGNCSGLNLNAIAKGFIVDRALAAVQNQAEVAAGVDGDIGEILINAGGDLLHFGSGSVGIGIEDPANPFDNSPPLTTIEIGNEAVATSGDSRRHVAVGDRRFNHVIDPRSGQPAATAASVTVVAPSATVADVLATALSVASPDEALALAEQICTVEPVAVLVVDRDHEQHPSTTWLDRFAK